MLSPVITTSPPETQPGEIASPFTSFWLKLPSGLIDAILMVELAKVALFAKTVVNEALVAARFVLVTFVPVAFVQIKSLTLKGLVTDKFVNDALVANRLVEVAPEVVRAPNTPFDAFNEVPEAVAKPSQALLVPFVKVKFVAV